MRLLIDKNLSEALEIINKYEKNIREISRSDKTYSIKDLKSFYEDLKACLASDGIDITAADENTIVSYFLNNK